MVRIFWRGSAVASALALSVAALSGCASSNSTKADTAQVSGTPHFGGTLTFAMSTLTPTLDPAALSGGGTVGSIELQSIYDTVVTWNDAAKKYEMETAQSLVPSSDYSVWTLKLKPGIKFADGTSYNAAAVEFNIERDMSATSLSSDKSLLTQFVKSMTVTGPLTLQFQLTQSWSTFPFVLSDTAGQIASPTQIRKLGANFGSVPSPAGAGPFVIQSYEPGVSLVVTRNPHYYGTKPYLNEVKFVASPSDPTVAMEDVSSGQFDAAYILDPPAVAAARAAHLQVVDIQNWSGTSLALNCASGPTANVLVRRAIAAAVNPSVINQRVYQGDLNADTALVGPGSAYNPHVPGPQYDPSLAKKLVTEAKSQGFNGSITMLTGTDPVSTAFGVAVQAMLDAVGFRISLKAVPTGTLVNQILISKNFQLALWALAYDDSDIFFRMFQSFSSHSDRYGYSSPAMDAAINELRVAATPAQETAAVGTIARIVNSDVPFLNIAWGERDIVTSPKVHGIEPTSDQAVLVGHAWLGN
jgi:peptide/nickel transport system substrate-binding protein